MINQLVLIEAGLVGGVLDLVLSLALAPVRNHTAYIGSIETVTGNVSSENHTARTCSIKWVVETFKV